MTHPCGLDFGTSNSTVGLADRGVARLLPLEGGRPTLPSAVFFHVEDGATSFGRAAIADYLSGHEGRLMRSLKSLLGSPTLDATTELHGRQLRLRDVLARFIGELRARALKAAADQGLDPAGVDHAVLGRPVRFVDDDEAADRLAEDTLREMALAAGFREVSCQFEPIAAAFDHESRIDREELVLVVDVGGGTSDFSLVRLGPERAAKADRRNDILANGGVHVAGTDFDRALSLAAVMPAFGYRGRLRNGREVPAGPYFDLATWHTINTLYTRKARAGLEDLRREAANRDAIDRLLALVEERDGHWLLMQVEEAKIALSTAAVATLTTARELAGVPLQIERATLDAALDPLLARIETAIRRTLADAGVAAPDVDTVFYTGGSSSLPALRERVARLLPDARAAEGDRFGSIGVGLALDAWRRYG